MPKSWKFLDVPAGMGMFIAVCLVRSLTWALETVLMVALGWLITVGLARQSEAKRQRQRKVIVVEDDDG